MEQLKKALKSIIKVVEKTDKAYEDKHISFGEWGGIAYSSLGLIRVVKNIGGLVKEYQDLTDKGRAELTEWFIQEFDIRNDKAEEIVEMVFAALMNLGEVFDLLKK